MEWEKVIKVKTISERAEIIQKLLSKDFEELKYSNYAHQLKYIDGEYLRNREKWATRNKFIETFELPDYDERIFWLCEDARKSYIFGIPKAVIIHSVLAAQQILKSLYLFKRNYSYEAYKELEESKAGSKGLTFGELIGKLNELDEFSSIITYFKEINSIRNTSVAHMKFVGRLDNNQDPKIEWLLKHINSQLELLNPDEKITLLKNKVLISIDNENDMKEIFIAELIKKKNPEIRYSQPMLEHQLDWILAIRSIKLLSKIHEIVKKNFRDMISEYPKYREDYKSL